MSSPRSVLALLFLINLLNYADRQVLYSLFPLIQGEMGVNDFALGRLGSAFMLVYMCAAPVVAHWARRGRRKDWIAGGLAFWSLATLFSGLSRSYAQLFAARSLMGVGESGYGAVSPAFVAEHFPKERRGGALAFFSMAIPVGSALGYMLGGWAGERWGWRSAFFFAGAPGFVLAWLAFHLKEPPSEGPAEDDTTLRWSSYLAIYRVRSYVASTLAMALMTFSLGGLAVWMPTFLNRFWGMGPQQAGLWFGGLTVAAGVLGSSLGGWLGDKLLKFTGKSYFLVSGLGLILAVPFGLWGLHAADLKTALGALFVAETLAFLNMGPLNGVIAWVTAAPLRTMAFAANIFVIHALGDAVSPAVIGFFSDRFGLKASLSWTMLFLGLAGAFCLWGARFVEVESSAAEKAAPKGRMA
ncbi:MAG: MFS transporter [Elusimicrobiota bacterium]